MSTLKSNDFVKVNSFGLAKRDKTLSDDHFEVRIFDDLVVAVVADGVGSALEGRAAAQRTVEALLKNFKIRPSSWTIEESLSKFIHSINRILYQESMEDYNYTELVTTLAVIVIDRDKLYGANVGDSRVYCKRNEELIQLTKDHNLNQKDMTHVLTKAIGLSDEVEPYFFESDVQQGDKFLLCSDGLYNELSNDKLISGIDLGAKAMVKQALKLQDNGQLPDDTSAVVVNIQGINLKTKSLDVVSLINPDKLEVNQVIDGYTLLEPLIQNQRTWKVKKSGNCYVMKFAPLEAKVDKRIHDLFINEAWNAKRLKAGFFVKAAVPRKRTMRYYIMAYYDGETLKDRIKKRPLSVDETIELGRFLLKASQFLINFNLVHGDIKPENIMVGERHSKTIFKLIDFGSITEVFSLDSKAGTPSYLAPERFTGEAICEQTEVYAISTVLYECLTQKLPYGDIEPFQTPSFSKTPKPAQQINRNIPDWLGTIILRSQTIDTNSRYRNFSEMLFDLEHPDSVKPFYNLDSSFLERNPLKFYKIAFSLSLILNIILFIQ
jgi:serine/threonine protein phosphatase PrpC